MPIDSACSTVKFLHYILARPNSHQIAGIVPEIDALDAPVNFVRDLQSNINRKAIGVNAIQSLTRLDMFAIVGKDLFIKVLISRQVDNV